MGASHTLFITNHLTPRHAELPASWSDPVDWAHGISVSMYDLGPTGRRNGEPVADCFGVLAYPEVGSSAFPVVLGGCPIHNNMVTQKTMEKHGWEGKDSRPLPGGCG
jgi:hypothetical protein